MTVDVPAGTRLGIVGETGSGKTTLGYLVARLYDAERGAVKIDGTDVRDATFESLAATVGVVSQETYLFHASIRDNLRFARPDATDEEIEDAARAAQIHDLIASLPDGYDTEVGERGYRFSGGEKQRIAIARTMLRNPPVLVLDEATSALDTETERQVQLALDRLSEGARRSRSRTGCPPSGTPTRSWCSTTAGSWSAARTRSCSSTAAATPSWWRATPSSSRSPSARCCGAKRGILPAVRRSLLRRACAARGARSAARAPTRSPSPTRAPRCSSARPPSRTRSSAFRRRRATRSWRRTSARTCTRTPGRPTPTGCPGRSGAT